jgi:hypothetical protein
MGNNMIKGDEIGFIVGTEVGVLPPRTLVRGIETLV